MTTAGKAARSKRIALRDRLWGDAQSLVFDTSDRKTKGYGKVPRVVPLVSTLINALGGRMNAGALYQVLWAHDWGEGLIEVRSFKSLLYEAGYTGKGARADRTWQERIKILRDLGFIRTKPKGLDDVGYILLLNPYQVVAHLEDGLAGNSNRPPKDWREQFVIFCVDWGIDLPAVFSAQ